MFEWCRSLEWFLFFSLARVPVNLFSHISFYDSTHQSDVVICINQRAGYESIHFLAVTLDLYTHLCRAINSNQGRLRRTSGIITVVSLIELLRAMTLLRRTVNKLLTLWLSFSLPFVLPNYDLRPVNLSAVFQIDRLVYQWFLAPIY